jgi:hypothetical protein
MIIHGTSYSCWFCLADYFIPPRLEISHRTICTYRRQVYGTWKTEEF